MSNEGNLNAAKKSNTIEGSKSNVIEESAKGISSLILVQIATKLFTFLLNQLLIKFISPKIFGLSIYLEFLISTILFFSRESIRLSIQRIQNNDDLKLKNKTLQKIINFGFLPIIISIPITLLIGYFQGFKSDNFQNYFLNLPFHNLVVVLLILSIFLELIIEPIYCIYQYQLEFGKRSKFESISLFVKCITTFIGVYLAKQYNSSSLEFSGLSVLAFAFGQISYSLSIFLLYSVSFIGFNKVNNTHIKCSITKIDEGSKFYYFDSNVVEIFKSFFIQMIFKQLLTEGDKLLIAYLCTIEEQGTYAVIVNYGSIIARLLFQPLEESTRLMLTKIINSTQSKSKSLLQSFTYIKMISLFYFNLCLFLLFAGITNGSFLLRFIIGGKNKWEQTEIFELFPLYIAYIPFLAFNGIFEAFFTSIVKPSDMQKYSNFLTFITISILGLSYLLIKEMKLRLSGLMIASMVNMLMRIIYCAIAIKDYFKPLDKNIGVSQILSYVSGSIAVTISIWLLQYFFVFKERSLLTTSWEDLFKSAVLSFVLLINLMILERQNLQHTIRSVFRIKTE
ncbi:RFT1 [Candida pseudojiufengensis]|uniref:RFT1 n=1 Tax=Candida pseudojiufengensis TaxID=497109 RepID=UPI0022240297|nr:RFT1 [Candida pseudojiufengensis]KAI5962220.1 RFT1 [Candida pseudojiufengensis]